MMRARWDRSSLAARSGRSRLGARRVTGFDLGLRAMSELPDLILPAVNVGARSASFQGRLLALSRQVAGALGGRGDGLGQQRLEPVLCHQHVERGGGGAAR